VKFNLVHYSLRLKLEDVEIDGRVNRWYNYEVQQLQSQRKWSHSCDRLGEKFSLHKFTWYRNLLHCRTLINFPLWLLLISNLLKTNNKCIVCIKIKCCIYFQISMFSWILFDLLGVGATIGSGVYILVGTVARKHSGPALTLSFLIAGIAAGLSAFCYPELACRCPSAGSAYHYSYICIGEV